VKRSGYILASFDTLAGITSRFMLGRKGRWYDNFTADQVADFFSRTTEGFLHSYGQEFPNKKTYKNYNKNYTNMLQGCLNTGLFKNNNLIIDSGGFQISIGRLNRKESELLFKMYYEWIQENYKMFQRYFILDIPPGPGCTVFNNFEDVYKMNLESYLYAKNLPDEVREKCIYIHHFRTPKLWEIYTKIMRENDMFSSFKYHGTGGVVANMDGDTSIPVIIYILPLIPLLNECKKAGRNFLNFHILGGANYRDVLFYKLFENLVRDKHGINLRITFDSSGVYKQTMHARFMYIFAQDGYIRKLHLKEHDLDKRFLFENTIHDTYQACMDELADTAGFKRIKIDDVYDNKTRMFHEDIKVYTLIYALYMYEKVEEFIEKFANDAMPYYYNQDYLEFNNRCINVTQKINQGRITKKQLIKTHFISKSLDLLTSLDEEYCHHLVKKFLAKDEFTYLHHGNMLTI